MHYQRELLLWFYVIFLKIIFFNLRDENINLPINSLALTLSQPADVLDMPVDPNEPTYCLCSQVSYGEMIGCDNSDCTIEWFHFLCVGLSTKPKGKWYCPLCTDEKKKKT